MTRAATAWPTQPAYVWGRAVVSARSADTASTLAALADYAALGLGRDVVVRAQLPDSTFWPEGMDYDARTKTFYVASVRHRTIAAHSADGATRELWPDRSLP